MKSTLFRHKKNLVSLATLFTAKRTAAFVLPKNCHQPVLASSTTIIRTMSSAPFSYNTYDSLPLVPSFEVTSTDITDGGVLPGPQLSKAFGVEGGEDTSPALSWSGFPPETKSFVVSCYDPDAPTVSGFWHWIVYDIPASVTSLASGAGTPGSGLLPKGAKTLKNDAGFAGFLGAAPPPGHGSHRYIFCVTALPVETLPIDEATSPSVCHFNMFGAGVLGRAFLTANFGR
uniref:YbhB/YbcL family Raf kinase inhibitor-like protein n=1 Tax=Amphora coffeiformis TaxID=265554 RepID=A0A7S3LD75_9STRA